MPGCPDWSVRSELNGANGAGSNYGCATNGNLAVMIADPQHLIRGEAGTGETTVMSSTKAIDQYRETKPTGGGALPSVSSQSAGSN